MEQMVLNCFSLNRLGGIYCLGLNLKKRARTR
jgi:hypothetical protein